MNPYSYFFTPNNDLHKIKKTVTIPSNYVVEFEQTPHPVNNDKLSKIAKELALHIEIVEESRNLTDQGNKITWEEFKKSHASKKK